MPWRNAHGEMILFCEAPESGPSQAQVDQWRLIEDNYLALHAQAAPLVRTRMKEFGEEHLFSELVWSGAGLSDDGSMDGQWELNFYLPRCSQASIGVHFEGGIPSQVTYDF